MNKYKLSEESILLPNGNKGFRIIALRDIPKHGVKKGDVGGYVESKKNLFQDGDCWVGGNTMVFDNAVVYGGARLDGRAMAYGSAEVFGNARVDGHAKVLENCWVYGSAHVGGGSSICGCTRLSE